MATVAELTVAGPGPDHPGVGVVLDLRTWLEAELRAITEPWSGPGGPLGITKNRVLAAARCPASVLAEADDLPLSAPLVIGSVVDMAASMLLVSDKVPGTAPWLGALMPVLHQTDPDQAAFIESLSVEARQELRDLVQEKGERLARLLGDVRSIPGTAQEMFRVELTGAGVSLSGRADLVLGRGRAPSSRSSRAPSGLPTWTRRASTPCSVPCATAWLRLPPSSSPSIPARSPSIR